MNDNDHVESVPTDSEIAEDLAARRCGPQTADEIRHIILEHLNKFAPHIEAYHEYAQRVAALSIEYHNVRLADVLGVTISEGVLVATLDARETPKSLDTKLSQIPPGTHVNQIVFDRVKAQYYLFI